MSGICGYAGPGESVPPGALERMLETIPYRGDRMDIERTEGAALGYRWWAGRPGKSPGIHREGSRLVACAGTLAPPVASPAAALLERIGLETVRTDGLDGAFAAACWDRDLQRLTLLRDPFGVRSIYYVVWREVFYFASELKQLLAVPGLPVEVNPVALHQYLTFSFVPGEDTPVQGVRRLPAGRVAAWQNGRLKFGPISRCARRSIPGSRTEGKRCARWAGIAGKRWPGG